MRAQVWHGAFALTVSHLMVTYMDRHTRTHTHTQTRHRHMEIYTHTDTHKDTQRHTHGHTLDIHTDSWVTIFGDSLMPWLMSHMSKSQRIFFLRVPWLVLICPKNTKNQAFWRGKRSLPPLLLAFLRRWWKTQLGRDQRKARVMKLRGAGRLFPLVSIALHSF